MATEVQKNGSWGFAACDCWTQTSVAGNEAKQRLLIEISHGVKRNIRCENWKEILLPTSFIRCKKKHCCQQIAFWDCCSNVGHFLRSVARVKRYVNVYFHLYLQQPEMVSSAAWKSGYIAKYNRTSTLPTLEKFCGRLCLCYLCLQSNICFVLRYIAIFVLFEYPLFQPLG